MNDVVAQGCHVCRRQAQPPSRRLKRKNCHMPNSSCGFQKVTCAMSHTISASKSRRTGHWRFATSQKDRSCHVVNHTVVECLRRQFNKHLLFWCWLPGDLLGWSPSLAGEIFVKTMSEIFLKGVIQFPRVQWRGMWLMPMNGWTGSTQTPPCSRRKRDHLWSGKTVPDQASQGCASIWKGKWAIALTRWRKPWLRPFNESLQGMSNGASYQPNRSWGILESHKPFQTRKLRAVSMKSWVTCERIFGLGSFWLTVAFHHATLTALWGGRLPESSSRDCHAQVPITRLPEHQEVESYRTRRLLWPWPRFVAMSWKRLRFAWCQAKAIESGLCRNLSHSALLVTNQKRGSRQAINKD